MVTQLDNSRVRSIRVLNNRSDLCAACRTMILELCVVVQTAQCALCSVSGDYSVCQVCVCKSVITPA